MTLVYNGGGRGDRTPFPVGEPSCIRRPVATSYAPSGHKSKNKAHHGSLLGSHQELANSEPCILRPWRRGVFVTVRGSWSSHLIPPATDFCGVAFRSYSCTASISPNTKSRS